MFKKYLLLSCILGLMLVGCGQKEDTGKQDTSATENMDAESVEQMENVVPDQSEIPETKTSDLKPDEISLGNTFDFSLAGIEEYDKIETDKYTDNPGKGKKYLLIYLTLNNKTKTPVYIPADGLTAEVDGKEVENTYLVNDPESYRPIFQNVMPSNEITGYIVWEVPSDWKEFTFTYKGIETTSQDVITATITPDMAFHPEGETFDR